MKWIARETRIPGVRLLENWIHRDDRGWFQEIWQGTSLPYPEMETRFTQENLSLSRRGVIRGLHWQAPPYEQVKLVRCVSGLIVDVVVDIRVESPTFGQYVTIYLSPDSGQALLIPEGMAHGFGVLSVSATVLYKCSSDYMPEYSCGIAWNDPEVGIPWRDLWIEDPILSDRDRAWPGIRDVTAERRLKA